MMVRRRATATVLEAASLCFPSHWRLHDKLGRLAGRRSTHRSPTTPRSSRPRSTRSSTGCGSIGRSCAGTGRSTATTTSSGPSPTSRPTRSPPTRRHRRRLAAQRAPDPASGSPAPARCCSPSRPSCARWPPSPAPRPRRRLAARLADRAPRPHAPAADTVPFPPWLIPWLEGLPTTLEHLDSADAQRHGVGPSPPLIATTAERKPMTHRRSGSPRAVHRRRAAARRPPVGDPDGDAPTRRLGRRRHQARPGAARGAHVAALRDGRPTIRHDRPTREWSTSDRSGPTICCGELDRRLNAETRTLFLAPGRPPDLLTSPPPRRSADGIDRPSSRPARYRGERQASRAADRQLEPAVTGAPTARRLARHRQLEVRRRPPRSPPAASREVTVPTPQATRSPRRRPRGAIGPQAVGRRPTLPAASPDR